MRKTFTLCFVVLLPMAVCLAETEPSISLPREPELYDHLRGMEQTQQRLLKLPPEEQERLQPKVRQAELQACQRLRQDRQKGVGVNEYRLQGGDQFVAYVLQFEHYCESLR